ncbi:S-methyl-5'-thioadenosine phosphorylase [bacterium]
MKIELGVIGGSGLYEIDGIKIINEIEVDTPFGKPSDKVIVGELNNKLIGFLPRHGRGHKLLPGEINYRANIYALKKLGAKAVLSVSIVGSMKEQVKPGDMVVVDQFIDLTKQRASTFFGEGIAGHTAFADPVCGSMSEALYNSAKGLGYSIQKTGTYVCMEGPQFSTRAESNVYRSWGVDVIGMTNMPEAKLAREAGMCYAVIALVSDYDCWHKSEEVVTVELVVKILNELSEKAKKILIDVIPKLNSNPNCNCHESIDSVIITSPDAFPKETKEKLAIFFDKKKENA